jgi:hypothetical protein
MVVLVGLFDTVLVLVVGFSNVISKTLFFLQFFILIKQKLHLMDLIE